MKLEQSFTVVAPLDVVWEALTDVERVAPCLPGATLGAGDGDGVYEGTFSVKLGPATAAYQGTLEMADLDEASRTTTMKASGRDRRGQGSASATIVSRLVEEGGATRVDVITDFTITGRLARFGRGGMIQDVSAKLLEEFSARLQERIAAQPAGEEPAAPAEAAADGGGGATTPAAAPPRPAAPAPPPPPTRPQHVNGLSLLLSVLRARLRRLFGRERRPAA